MDYKSIISARIASLLGQKFIILSISGVLMAGFPIISPFIQTTKADLLSADLPTNANPMLALMERNTLMPISSPQGLKATQRIPVIITGYSSSPLQTDDTPLITAAGTQVREGVIANNWFAFGTKIRIPALYGNKIFVVEDRMSWKKGNYHFDIWFSSYSEAKNFGAKTTYVEILEN